MSYEIGFEDALEIGAAMVQGQPAKAASLARVARAGTALSPVQRVAMNRPPIVPVYAGSRQSGMYETGTYLPLGQVQFVNAGVVAQNLQQAGQGNMRAHRLLLERFNVGAASPGIAATVTGFFIGTYNCAIGTGVTGVGIFAPTAIANPVIAGVPVTPGMLVTVGLAVGAAPAAQETITIAGALFGEGV